MAFTRPMLLAWITFTWPDGMIFPGATATISMRPTMDQMSASVIMAITAHIVKRPTGDGGDS